MIPNILSIAGSDPSGGAGIQADIKTISANGGYAMAVVTGLTAQNTLGVTAVEMVSDQMITAQIGAIKDDIEIHAIKIGMLGNARAVSLVADSIKDIRAPIVLDPVMVAKGGERLLQDNAVAALRDTLLPMATIVTPNLPEAADLLDDEPAQATVAMISQAKRLLNTGCSSVLLKGGHMGGETAVDVFVDHAEEFELTSPRIKTRNTHGTGCTLSSALATQLGLGKSTADSARHAKAYIGSAISAQGALAVGHGHGHGHGPVHHFAKSTRAMA